MISARYLSAQGICLFFRWNVSGHRFQWSPESNKNSGGTSAGHNKHWFKSFFLPGFNVYLPLSLNCFNLWEPYSWVNYIFNFGFLFSALFSRISRVIPGFQIIFPWSMSLTWTERCLFFLDFFFFKKWFFPVIFYCFFPWIRYLMLYFLISRIFVVCIFPGVQNILLIIYGLYAFIE